MSVRNCTVAMLLAASVAGCASTTLVNMWKDPNYPRTPVSNVMVVALRHDNASRRVWEDDFANALKARGVNATPSYQLFPDQAPDTASLSSAVRGRGFDAVLVSHQASNSTESRYVPGYLATEPVTYLSPWTGHYYTYFTDVYSPGYVEMDRVVRYETEIWTTRGPGRLVWSGTTESINPGSSEQVHKEVTDVIVPALIRSGVTRAG